MLHIILANAYVSVYIYKQVNKLAQKTDAKQLSRNLLLVPLATVNVKPNLQVCTKLLHLAHKSNFQSFCGARRFQESAHTLTSKPPCLISLQQSQLLSFFRLNHYYVQPLFALKSIPSP